MAYLFCPVCIWSNGGQKSLLQEGLHFSCLSDEVVLIFQMLTPEERGFLILQDSELVVVQVCCTEPDTIPQQSILIVLKPVLGVELCQVAVSWAVSGTVWRVGFKDLVVGRLDESPIRKENYGPNML